MIRQVFKFIFAPPPVTPERLPMPVARMIETQPDESEPRERGGLVVESGVAAVVFLGVAAISFAIFAYAMKAVAPLLIPTALDSAEHVLRPSGSAFVQCAVLPALVAGLAAAWFYVTGQEQFKNPFFIAKAALVVVLLAGSCAPFLLMCRSSVKFTNEAVQIDPVFGAGVLSYPYSEIKGLRASLARPAGGWLPGRTRFVFAIDFADGNTWSSLWYPYESEAGDDATLMRFLAKKSGKPAMPAQVL